MDTTGQTDVVRRMLLEAAHVNGRSYGIVLTRSSRTSSAWREVPVLSKIRFKVDRAVPGLRLADLQYVSNVSPLAIAAAKRASAGVRSYSGAI